MNKPTDDSNAKKAFCAELRSRRYINVKIITRGPADISASLDGVDYLFEIKYTNRTETYFGAATLTEWISAMENPNTFKFVVAYKRYAKWTFHEYTPAEFLTLSYIPPFKI